MNRISTTAASERAQAAYAQEDGIRGAFDSLGLVDDDGEPITFDDVIEWAAIASELVETPAMAVGAIAGAMLVAVELERTRASLEHGTAA